MLPEFEPVDAGGVEATKKAFLAAVNRGVYNMADHHFLWLWEHIPAVEAFDLLLSVSHPQKPLTWRITLCQSGSRLWVLEKTDSPD